MDRSVISSNFHNLCLLNHHSNTYSYFLDSNYSEDTVQSFQQQTCPSGGNNNNGNNNNNHHSGDASSSKSISGSNTFTRYGKIKGYGYSTNKCICYTDGSGYV